MILKVNGIIIYGVLTFLLSLLLYPLYIRFLHYIKAGKTLRDDDVSWQKANIFRSLHSHKAWTPTMWWGLFLIVVLIMVWLSFLLQHYWIINNNLFNRQETYILLFWFFSMWCLGLLDDILNIKSYNSVKWLSALGKTIGMIFFAWFISYWFYYKLQVDRLLLWPGIWKISIGLRFLPISFFATLFITHAINITDWLDWLAGGMSSIILSILAFITFINQTYIATTLIIIIVAVLLAFLWFNINPAQVFMWDSGAFSIGGILATLLWLLNMRIWILLPFFVIFSLFSFELISSFLQIITKKIYKKKLFPIAPFHHLCEYYGMKEYTIVMRFRFIQWLLGIITLVIILYSLVGYDYIK